ncbi:MAG: peptidylprolyl isomerase [Deltaproteobacteria bacterium]|nr:peptidylprolyl isomerase [Deltaproteobacteria bacterium]
MRSTSIAFVTLLSLGTLLGACEKKKDGPKAGGGGAPQQGGGGKKADDLTPEPVGKDPNAVRAPVAEDLAEYTKDIPGTGKLTTTIETSMGSLHCELYDDKAPLTVANFIGLATGKKAWKNPNGGAVEVGKPFFNGLIFHRVIPGFMIQGGCPLGQGTGGPGYRFRDEVGTGLTMEPGNLAMANSGANTNGSQFFVMEGAADWLNDRHTIFGKCAELDLIKQITNVEKVCPTCDPQRDPRHDRPKEPITIKSITFGRR